MYFQKDRMLKASFLSGVAAERQLYHAIDDSTKGLIDWWVHTD